MPLYALVSLDTRDKVIRERIVYDGEPDTLRVPGGTKLLIESDAVKDGYTYPPPDPVVVNRQTLEQRAVAALDVNNTYLAREAPTNAQNLAQIRALTRECSALIRLVVGRLDDTEGT